MKLEPKKKSFLKKISSWMAAISFPTVLYVLATAINKTLYIYPINKSLGISLKESNIRYLKKVGYRNRIIIDSFRYSSSLRKILNRGFNGLGEWEMNKRIQHVFCVLACFYGFITHTQDRNECFLLTLASGRWLKTKMRLIYAA